MYLMKYYVDLLLLNIKYVPPICLLFIKRVMFKNMIT